MRVGRRRRIACLSERRSVENIQPLGIFVNDHRQKAGLVRHAVESHDVKAVARFRQGLRLDIIIAYLVRSVAARNQHPKVLSPVPLLQRPLGCSTACVDATCVDYAALEIPRHPRYR